MLRQRDTGVSESKVNKLKKQLEETCTMKKEEDIDWWPTMDVLDGKTFQERR